MQAHLPVETVLFIIGFALIRIAKDLVGLGNFLELAHRRSIVFVQVRMEVFG
jgi:hypothetical protein